MPELIRNGALTPDAWTYLGEDDPLPGPELPVIVPWSRRGELKGRAPSCSGVVAEGHTELSELAAIAPQVALIALRVPKFTDGRHYSNARLLRERHGYRGELRVTGDVVPDQVFYMHRVGYDAFELPAGPRSEAALRALSTFSITYQGAVRGEPLHRRRLRAAADAA